MSLRYLWNKLERMSPKEQYAYIQNIFLQFQVRPRFNIDDLFKDTSAKEATGKNPLGYLVMHLTPEQLAQLVPKYLRELVDDRPFSNDDYQIMNIILEVLLNGTGTGFTINDFPVNMATHADMLAVFEFGVAKYSPWSFLKLNPYVLVPALFRHLYKHYYISAVDEESGLPHIAHAACNIRMINLIRRNNGP